MRMQSSSLVIDLQCSVRRTVDNMLLLTVLALTLQFFLVEGETDCLADRQNRDLNVRESGFVYYLEKNRANVTFLWDEANIKRKGNAVHCYHFLLSLGNEIPIDQSLFYKPRKQRIRNKTYTVRLGFNYSLQITRIHKKHIYNPSTAFFSVPDIDGCSPPQNLSSFCDVNANCVDLTAKDTAPAMCSCEMNSTGNGISTFWGGLECRSPVRSVIPLPTLPPNQTLIIIGLTAGFCFVIGMLYWCRIRNKRRKENESFSLYVFNHDGGEPTYESLTQSKNGVFGSKWEIDRDLITVKEMVGRGNFGIVHKAILHGQNEQRVVAIKTVYGNLIESEFLAEINLLISLGSHANIASIIGCCTTRDNPILLVIEYMMYGDLLHFLWDVRDPSEKSGDTAYCLKECHLHVIGRQVACGMTHLKHMKIIHGDLSARNILVGKNLLCKITDFGLANDVYRYGMIRTASEKRVPYKWISPERMFNGLVPITWRSDIWSFGILLYEMVTLGSAPHQSISTADLLQRLKSGYRMSKPDTCSTFLYKLMRRCWQWTPSKRPSFKELESLLTEPCKENEVLVNSTLIEVKEQYQEGLEIRSPLELRDIKVLIGD